MKNSKDLNWLSTPAFFLILGIIVVHVKRNMDNSRYHEKSRTEAMVICSPK